MADYTLLSLFIGGTVFFALTWILYYQKHRFTIFSAILFYTALGCNAFTAICAFFISDHWLAKIYGFLSFFMPLLAALTFLVLGIYLFLVIFSMSAQQMMKKERGSFSNRLSLLLSALLFLYIVFSILLSTTEFRDIQFLRKIHVFVTVLGFSVFFYFFLFVSASILSHLFPPRKNKSYIVVLGSGLINGKVPPLLASRIDVALRFSQKQLKKTGVLPIFIFSGGQGSDEIMPEACAMAKYAEEKGLPMENIRIEDQSKNTKENMAFSRALILSETSALPKHILFSTNDYHVFRAGFFANHTQLYAVGIGSKTKFYYRLNAVIREYIAYLTLFPRRHLVLGIGAALLSLALALTSFS